MEIKLYKTGDCGVNFFFTRFGVDKIPSRETMDRVSKYIGQHKIDLNLLSKDLLGKLSKIEGITGKFEYTLYGHVYFMTTVLDKYYTTKIWSPQMIIKSITSDDLSKLIVDKPVINKKLIYTIDNYPGSFNDIIRLSRKNNQESIITSIGKSGIYLSLCYYLGQK